MTGPELCDRDGGEIGDVLIRPVDSGGVLACRGCGGRVGYTEQVTRDVPAGNLSPAPGPPGGFITWLDMSSATTSDDGTSGSLYCTSTGDHLATPHWLNLDWM